MKRLQNQCPILPGESPELAWIPSPVHIRTAETEESPSEDDGGVNPGEFALLVHINAHLIVQLVHRRMNVKHRQQHTDKHGELS